MIQQLLYEFNPRELLPTNIGEPIYAEVERNKECHKRKSSW